MKVKQLFYSKVSLSCLVIIFSTVIIFSVYTIKNSLAEAVTVSQMAGGSLTGTVTLTSDTTFTSAINVPAGQTLTLDLNGFVLKHANSERPFIVGSGSTLIIKDSNPTKSHYGTISDDLWVYNSSATSGVEIKGGIITGGIKSDRGGAIFNWGNVIMEGGTIAGCKAVPNASANENDMSNYPVNTFTNGAGGAIYINEPGTFTMNGGAIKYCKATIGNSITTSEGGAVFIDSNAGNSSTFTMNGGEISNCRAMNGGAVFVHSNLTTGNSVRNAAVFNMSGGTISNCYASGLTSGVSQNYGGGAIFVNATAAATGAIESVGKFNMTGGNINYNKSNGSGGAIYSLGEVIVEEGTIFTGNTTVKTGEILDGLDAYSGYGGTIYTTGSLSKFTMNGGTISESISASGGAVMVWTGSTFTMNNGTISNCKSLGTGGTGNGGAVYVQAATFNFNNGTLSSNQARRYGGAVNINKTAKLYLNGACNIVGNIANHGGGLSQEDGDCQIKLDNEEILIKGNKAIGTSKNGNGGGVFVEKGELEISACTIEENSSEQNGGGIALRVERIGGDITVNMTGGIIRNNTANSNGGGIDIYADHTFVSDEVTDDANKINDVVVNLKSGILDNNKANLNGGGINIYVNEANGTAQMNIAEASKAQLPEITNNTSSQNGGGICINGGSITINNGIINKCSAVNGGGVFVSGGDMHISGGTLSECTSTTGAGISVHNGNVYMDGGIISNNEATDYGGGIYANSDNESINVTITSGSIINNVSKKHGGGIGVNTGNDISATVIVGLESCNGTNTSHSHPIITGNTAVEQGGGICIHGNNSNVWMYCGNVEKNAASGDEGASNINQTGGNVTIYAGNIDNGISIVGGEYIYHPDEQLPKSKITYCPNFESQIETKQALITTGVIVSLPKTVFVRTNYILVGWATAENPGEGDIVYSTGDEFSVPASDTTLYAIWKHIGAGTPQTPCIKSGKNYDKITGMDNIVITNNSAFTVQMDVLSMQPSIYDNRTLEFDKNLVNGTSIVMVDLSDNNNRKYYYYNVENENTDLLPLSSFTKMGGANVKYENSVSTELVDECFLFIFELPNENSKNETMQIKLVRNSTTDDVDKIEQDVNITTSGKREFSLNWTNKPGVLEDFTIEDTFKLSYETVVPSEEETRYENRNIALIISSQNETSMPKDAKLTDGTNYYNLTGNGKFIIPFGNINENKEISLKLISQTAKVLGIEYSLKAEIFVSANADNTKPFLGECVASVENINLKPILLPALKVNMEERIINLNEFDKILKVNYQSKNLEGYKVTLDIQKKNSEKNYETKLDIIESVNNATLNTNGSYELQINGNGTLNLTLKDLDNLSEGTYRILLKVIDGDTEKYIIPYNFILVNLENYGI